jgi:hypothetical protein
MKFALIFSTLCVSFAMAIPIPHGHAKPICEPGSRLVSASQCQNNYMKLTESTSQEPNLFDPTGPWVCIPDGAIQ